MFSTPEEHAANPPSTWKVVKAAERCWHVQTADGVTIIYANRTKREAEELTRTGRYVKLYDQNTRWYAGEQVPGWRPYAEIKVENERRAARQAAKGA